MFPVCLFHFFARCDSSAICCSNVDKEIPEISVRGAKLAGSQQSVWSNQVICSCHGAVNAGPLFLIHNGQFNMFNPIETVQSPSADNMISEPVIPGEPETAKQSGDFCINTLVTS